MCKHLDAVHDAQAFGLDVDRAACRRVVKSPNGERVAYECEHYAACPYILQRAKRADLWLVPHELLYLERPTAIGELAAVIVDESAWQDGLEGVDGAGILLPLDALGFADKRFQGEHAADWAVIQHHRSRALDGLRGLTDGAVTREALAAEGLTAGDCAEARALEFKRKVDPNIHPCMAPDARRTALKAAEGNRTILRLAAFWRAAEHLLGSGGPQSSGWAKLTTVEAKDSTPTRMIRLQGRRPVRSGWTVPTLLIDATFDASLCLPFWPQLEQIADLKVEAPHQHIRQVVDRSYSKGRLVPLPADRAEADPEEARRRMRALREVRAVLVREARRHHRGRVLAVVQLDVREALVELGPLPANLELAHHNAVAGMDRWRDVAALVVVGRTAPWSGAMERLAEALTGAEVTALGRWYDQAQTTREMAGGRAPLPAQEDRHPHSIAEAIRRQICAGELVQIIGRARGVNRSALDPVDVLVMTDVVLPLPIEQAVTAAELVPDLADRMLAEGGIVFKTPRHAASAYPSLWPNWEAAKKALNRVQKGTFPNKNIPSGGCPLLVPILRQVDYQRAGPRQSPAIAWFDPLLVPDPSVTLAALLGPLAWCRVVNPDPSPQPEAEPPAMYDIRPALLFPPIGPQAALPPADLLVVRRPGERPIQIVRGDQRLPTADGEKPMVMPPWVGVRLAAEGHWWPPW